MKTTGFSLLSVLLALAPGVSSASERVPIGPESTRFWIDATEVTIAAFAAFADRTQRQTAAEQSGGGYEYRLGWQQRPGWTFRTPFGRSAQTDEPAVHLSWYEAQAYCQEAGGRLPTREQWEQAAYTEWRDQPPAPFVTRQTYPYPTGQTGEGANVAGSADGWAEHAPVGRTRPGVNGLFDMGANVWEWLEDARGDARLTAGGSWWYGPEQMRASGMQYKPADFFAVYVGFRCVYSKAAR